MRKTKKTLALLLALAMVLTLFAGVAQASAYVRITSSTAVTTPGSDRNLGTISVSYDAALGVPTIASSTVTVIMVTLPSGVTWDDEDVSSTRATATTTPAVITGAWTSERLDAQTAKFTVATTTYVTSTLTIIPRVDIASGFRGDINVTVAVQSENSYATEIFWIQSETERLGTVAAPGTISTAPSPTNVMRGVGNQAVSDIRIRENTPGSIATTTVVTLALPSGVTFANATTTGLNVSSTLTTFPSSTVTTTVATSTPIQTVLISAIRLNVGPNVPDGPIIVTISGAEITPTTVTVATVGAVGLVTVAPRNVPADPITAGRLGEEVADIRLTENVDGALMGHRTVSLTLPVGFTWNSVSVHDTILLANPEVSDGGRTLTYWTHANPTPSTGSHFDITDVRINTRIDAPAGDIVVTVGGTAGVSGTAVIGTLRRPVTVAAVTVPNVRADASGQALGNIVLTEAFVGSLMGGTIQLALPSGFTFDGAPTITVSDVVGTEPSVTSMTLISAGSIATATTTAAITPTNAATITISGIRVNADLIQRTVFGPLNVNVRGTAILEVQGAIPNVLGHAPSHGDAVGANIATIVAGNVVSATASRTVFTIGQTAFTVDGVAQTPLEEAPFIDANGRTMLPLRAVAQAIGVSARNIMFNDGVITIVRGDRIVQFTLGRNVMLVNGMVIPMDTAPVLRGVRSFVPIRPLEVALGVSVVWDGPTRTVAVSVQ